MVCDRRRPNHRGAAADGLRLCYATLSGIDRQPHAAQSRQHRRRVAGIAAGVAMVSLTTLRQLTLTNLLPFLPSALDDVNIGIAALPRWF